MNASDDASSRPSSGVGGVYLEVPPGGKFRATSFNSETSECSSARSLARYDVIPNLLPMISIHKYDVLPNLLYYICT